MGQSRIGRITISAVERLQADETLSDDSLPGFYVRRQRQRAVYGVRARLKARRIRLTIGWHGRFTPEQARTEAKRLIGLLAAGVDPRVKPCGSSTVRDTAEQFLVHIEAKRANGTAEQYRRHLEIHLLPRFANKALEDVGSDALAKLHLKLRDQPVLANRVLDTVSSLYGWAARRRLCPSHLNPASKRIIERYHQSLMPTLGVLTRRNRVLQFLFVTNPAIICAQESDRNVCDGEFVEQTVKMSTYISFLADGLSISTDAATDHRRGKFR